MGKEVKNLIFMDVFVQGLRKAVAEFHKEGILCFAMNQEQILQILENSGHCHFSRSGGPGGQNVNKLSTKVLLTLPLDALKDAGLNDVQLQKLRRKLAGRINSRDELYVQVQQERSQMLNRQRGRDRMAQLILNALHTPKRRKKTKPGAAAVRKRLENKKKQGRKKRERQNIFSLD